MAFIDGNKFYTDIRMTNTSHEREFFNRIDECCRQSDIKYPKLTVYTTTYGGELLEEFTVIDYYKRYNQTHTGRYCLEFESAEEIMLLSLSMPEFKH